jgi:DNA-binding XRE family transcriptional regulator
MSQVELAKHLHIPRQTLQHIMTELKGAQPGRQTAKTPTTEAISPGL